MINLSAVSLTPPNSLSSVLLSPLINIHSRLSPRIFEKTLKRPNMGYPGARGTLVNEKKLKLKISCQTPFNMLSKISELQVLKSELKCLKHENLNLCERRKNFIVLGRGLNL